MIILLIVVFLCSVNGSRFSLVFIIMNGFCKERWQPHSQDLSSYLGMRLREIEENITI